MSDEKGNELSDFKIGQIWEDRDSGRSSKLYKVLAVLDTKIKCEWVESGKIETFPLSSIRDDKLIADTTYDAGDESTPVSRQEAVVDKLKAQIDSAKEKKAKFKEERDEANKNYHAGTRIIEELKQKLYVEKAMLKVGQVEWKKHLDLR